LLPPAEVVPPAEVAPPEAFVPPVDVVPPVPLLTPPAEVVPPTEDVPPAAEPPCEDPVDPLPSAAQRTSKNNIARQVLKRINLEWYIISLLGNSGTRRIASDSAIIGCTFPQESTKQRSLLARIAREPRFVEKVYAG
jgi:hypothetical protein